MIDTDYHPSPASLGMLDDYTLAGGSSGALRTSLGGNEGGASGGMDPHLESTSLLIQSTQGIAGLLAANKSSSSFRAHGTRAGADNDDFTMPEIHLITYLGSGTPNPSPPLMPATSTYTLQLRSRVDHPLRFAFTADEALSFAPAIGRQAVLS